MVCKFASAGAFARREARRAASFGHAPAQLRPFVTAAFRAPSLSVRPSPRGRFTQARERLQGQRAT